MINLRIPHGGLWTEGRHDILFYKAGFQYISFGICGGQKSQELNRVWGRWDEQHAGEIWF